MSNKRKLRESKSAIELAIQKCLNQARLNDADLRALSGMGYRDLVVDYGLSQHAAREVLNCCRLEQQRQTHQDIYDPSFVSGALRVVAKSSIKEGAQRRAKIRRLIESCLASGEAKMVSSGAGRMLDYGQQASDSDEGRMFKQTLHRILGDAEDLQGALTDHDDLPQWCHYKVAEAAAAISKVRDYLLYKIDNPEDPWQH